MRSAWCALSRHSYSFLSMCCSSYMPFDTLPMTPSGVVFIEPDGLVLVRGDVFDGGGPASVGVGRGYNTCLFAAMLRQDLIDALGGTADAALGGLGLDDIVDVVVDFYHCHVVLLG